MYQKAHEGANHIESTNAIKKTKEYASFHTKSAKDLPSEDFVEAGDPNRWLF